MVKAKVSFERDASHFHGSFFPNLNLHSSAEIDLCFHVPSFPALFDLLISLGQLGLIILLLESGSTLSALGVIPYLPIKLLGFSFQPIRRRYLDN